MEDQFYANCWVFTTNVFSVLSCGIRVHHPILTRVEFERMVIFREKMLFLMPNFQIEGLAYVNCLFNIFTNYNQWVPSQLLSRGIHMHISVLTGFKMDPSVAEKVVIFGRKKPVFKLNWQGEGGICDNGVVVLKI